MADPYFNPHALYSEFQKAYESVMSSSGLILNGCTQQSGLAFGLQVEQTSLGNYLNTLIPCGESFHNPFSDSRFKKVPVRVIYSQEPGQIEPSDLPQKPGTHQQTDKNTQLELRIDRVWSMASEASSHSHFINTNPHPHTSMLQDIAGSELAFKASAFDSGKSLAISPDKTRQKDYARSEKRKAYQKAYYANRKAYLKAYAQSEKQKAYQKAYAQTEKRKAYQKAYHKTYAHSEKRKAYQRTYQRAYREVLKNTGGDQEQARIAARRAPALIKESNKAKNNEIASTSISTSLSAHF